MKLALIMLRSGSAAPMLRALDALKEREHVLAPGEKASLDERRIHWVGGAKSKPS